MAATFAASCGDGFCGMSSENSTAHVGPNLRSMNGRTSERMTAWERTPASRRTISCHTFICAPPAREPVSACAREVSVPPVASRTISFSWCSMKLLNGSVPREPPAKSVMLLPLGHTLTCPFSTAFAAAR